MASAVLGKVSPTPKGEYVSTQDYDRLDVVTYEGYPYLAKSNVPSGNLPTDELYWMPLLTGLDFAPGGYGLGEQTSNLIDSNTLLSSVTKGGMYYWTGGNTDPDKPFNSGELLVIPRAGAGHLDQIAFGKDSTVPKVKIRQCLNAGSWSGWQDWSPSAFAPSGYGLGGMAKKLTSNDNLDDVWECGYYAWYNVEPVNAPSFGGQGGAKFAIMHVNALDKYSFVQEVTHIYYGQPNLTQKRTKTDTLLGEWEWENPPMKVDVEYRTTERWRGKAVYTMMCAYTPSSITATYQSLPTNVSWTEAISAELNWYDASSDTWRFFPSAYHGNLEGWMGQVYCAWGTALVLELGSVLCERMQNSTKDIRITLKYVKD